MYLVIFLVISVPIALILKQLYSKYKQRQKYLSEVPGPKGKFLVGNALEIAHQEKFLDKLNEFRGTYGDIFKISIGTHLMYVITDLKLLEYILSSNDLLEKGDTYRYSKAWLGSGLINSKAEKWRRHRKLITPTFHFKILEQFVEVFHSNAAILVDKLEDELKSTSSDILKLLSFCTLDIICETAMGTKLNAQLDTESEYIKSVDTMNRMAMTRTFSAGLQFDFIYHFHPLRKEEEKAVEVLHARTEGVIKQRKEAFLQGKYTQNEVDEFGRKKKTAFLDLLIQVAYGSSEQSFTDMDIRDEVSTFMFAGHHTTAHAMSFTLYAIANHSEIQKKIVEELDAIFQGDRKRAPTFAELHDMKYLEMVVKEGLRMYPPAPLIGRKLTEDLKYEKYTFVEGSMLLLSLYGMHMDPKNFPEPEKFDPERFAGTDGNKINNFTFVPFSAGPRNCIGQKYAMLEMKTVLSTILRNYQVLPAIPRHQLKLSIEMLLSSATGIHIRFEKRS